MMLLVVIFSACNQDQQNTIQDEEDAAPAASLANAENRVEQTTETTQKNDSNQNFISVRGYVDVPPDQRVSVSPFYGGYIREIKVLPGTRVSKGDVLFTMQNPYFVELQQQYLEAVQQLEYLKENFERQKVLSSEEITSKKSYKKAESDYKVMTAKASGLREQLKMLELSISAIERGQIFSSVSVRSSIKGSVTAVNIQKGAYIDPGNVAVNIINTEHLHLELEVFEQDASRINEGQEIRFSVPEMSAQEYLGSVYLIVPAIDLQKRTILVHGHIEEEVAMDLLPGMYVEAKIMVGVGE